MDDLTNATFALFLKLFTLSLKIFFTYLFMVFKKQVDKIIFLKKYIFTIYYQYHF